MYEYLSPVTTLEAVEILGGKQNLRILAGGTDLIIALKDRAVACDYLVDIKKIPELQKIEMTSEGLEIGAAVTLGEMLDSGLLKGWYKSLAQSAADVANSLLRNRATLVGNICNASPGGDMLPACLVGNAVVKTISPAGGRTIPLKEFFTGVKKHVLTPTEIAAKVVLPYEEGQSAFRKKKRIRGHDLAQVSVAASYTKAGVLQIAFGAAAPTPLLIELGTYDAKALRAQKDELIEKALKSATPISDVRSSKEYRMAMLRHLANEVIDEILDEAGGKTS